MDDSDNESDNIFMEDNLGPNARCLALEDTTSKFAVEEDHFQSDIQAPARRLYEALYYGGERSNSVPTAIQTTDVRKMIDPVDDGAGDEPYKERVVYYLKLCASFLSDLGCPLRGDTVKDIPMSLDDRACEVYFKAPFASVFNNGVLTSRVDGGPRVNDDLIDVAYERVRDNLQIIRFSVSNIQEVVKKTADDVLRPEGSVSSYDDVNDLCSEVLETQFQRACDELEIYRTALKSSVRSIATLRFGNADANPGALYRFLRPHGGEDPVNYHARLIMDYFFLHGLKRHIRTMWQPKKKHNTKALPVKEECDGIYQRVTVTEFPVSLLFDTERNLIVGLKSKYFDEDNNQKAAMPASLNTDNIAVATKCAGCCFHGNNLYGTNGMCCDLYHTKVRRPDDRWNLVADEWKNCRNWDLSKKADDNDPHHAHCFAPTLIPVEIDADADGADGTAQRRPVVSIATRGYSKFATLDDFVDRWFSSRNSEQAEIDALTHASLKSRIKEHFRCADLPEALELYPNDFVYMFADGYLVCDNTLVDLPQFFPLSSKEFQTGRFRSVDTLNIFSDIVFRYDEYQAASLVLQDQQAGVGRCLHCGCDYDTCLRWQRDYEDEVSRMVFTFSRLCEVYPEMVDDGDLLEEVDADAAMGVNFAFTVKIGDTKHSDGAHIIGPHVPRVYPDIPRTDGSKMALNLDLGVIDDILLYQYDWQKPWIDLPEDLCEERPDGRFWAEQLPRIRNESLFLWGRNYYRQGQFYTLTEKPDKLQIMLGTIGTSNTGKSTILNMVKKGMDPRSVGVIDCATFEEKFGMQQIFNKRLVIMNEVEMDSRTFTAGLFKQCTDGSIMSVPQKNKEALTGSLQAHMWFLGNERLFSCDPSGAIGRRSALMYWEREVSKQRIDPQLEMKFHLHFGHFLAAMFCVYWAEIEQHADRDFWYKESGNRYPYFSWIWHHQRDKGETTTSKLKGALQKFQTSVHEWRFSPKDMVTSFRAPKTKPVSEQRSTFELDTDDPAVKAEWEDAATGEFKVAVAYMPFDAIGEATGRACRGFKYFYNQKLKDMFPGSKPRPQDMAWDRDSDFYGRDFDKEGIKLLKQGWLPWPPNGNLCINCDWVIGCCHLDIFKDSNGQTEQDLWEQIPQRRVHFSNV